MAEPDPDLDPDLAEPPEPPTPPTPPTASSEPARARVQRELRRRAVRLRRTALPIVQAGLSAGFAWLIAVHLIGHPHPYFAPIAAVVSLGVSLGQRLRRAVELVIGVSVGIGVGDTLISAIGSGWWQIALVVMLAMTAAVVLDGGAVIALQSASSAVLVATLLPPTQAGGFARMIDAAVGGAVGILVTAILPANPLTVAQRQARAMFGGLADALTGAADAVRARNAGRAASVLTTARGSQKLVDEFKAALTTGTEIATVAPIRWRRRGELDRYRVAADPIDRALRNTRVLLRREIAALRDGEPVAEYLPEVMARLAGVVLILRDELAAGAEPVGARAAAHTAASELTLDRLGAGGFSMRVVVAQLRSIAVDLLQATGMGRDEAADALPPLRQNRPPG